ncbi:hypothetical protein HDV01_000846 [Terramyces sp. JEL0728]|nr:hypothetical protein HDV01_000846 [Terramyces sp. JEL0728]
MITDYVIIIGAFIQIVGTIIMIYRVLAKKTVITFYKRFLCMLTSDLLLGGINFYYPIAVMIERDIQLFALPATNFLLSFIVLNIVLLDIEVLRVFSILNDKITDFKLNIFTGFVIFAYLALALIPQIIKYSTSSAFITQVYYLTAELFAFIGIIVDNSIAFYLPFLVYSYKYSNVNRIGPDLQRNLIKLVIYNLAILMIDWVAYGFSVYAALAKVAPTDADYLPRDAYYNIVAEILVGIHSIFQIIILDKLKSLTLSEMQEIATDSSSTTVTSSLPPQGKVYNSLAE